MLSGIRVLDLSRILAGPWCTQLLADYGADVLKIEKPGSGDDTRRWGPPFLRGGQSPAVDGDVAAYFLCCNRGKRSLALDFTQAEGQQILRRLAEASDVLVENYLPGTLQKYGLDYASLAALNPRLIYCSISGFGQDGPNAARAGYDAMIQAEAGLMSLTGEAAGGPMKVGVAVSDLMCGMYAASAILATLHERSRTQRGAQLDLALFDCQVGWLANQGMNYRVGGTVPPRHGTAHPNIAPYQVFATADGHLMLAVGNDEQFRRFCAAADAGALAADARFGSNAQRVANRVQLVSAMTPLLAARSTQDWLQQLGEAGVPAGPVNDLAAVFAHSQVEARGLAASLTHPLWGEVPQIANPLRRDGKPQLAPLAPPDLGEHGEAVLAELGLDAQQRADLVARGIVGGGRG
ncbi:crotonobetainyl-CoA:carnitine CoA-transferase CaiB-like acyl-CoA transferase [Tahibacter aquaticus]|uniref:Crotonobetainyl-CoA:carnitine CoA-transferase CaiB-like acyl-CoA transferase n=1 Tax=Tahibacter aquaticus TaxID=520092 RepID=A0A4R6Z4C5_9GAMM|nr:CaiB/BaiF CoA-transferase family protein [Tahibacter aquaticus]TDR46512.1 crotonobetainyl-CoA:carnitine CoA-transferase CaiB-like acyl-CoA transferase [Tahibacter aquaticus]